MTSGLEDKPRNVNLMRLGFRRGNFRGAARENFRSGERVIINLSHESSLGLS